MTQTEALKLALEALESFVQPDSCEHGFWWEDCPNDTCEKVKDMKAITAIKEALAQEKALQTLHDENERLGLYKDAYAEPELETTRLQCVTCGTVYADGVPAQVAQPEQEPVAWRYKPAREDNPRWEYTTNHPLDMGDGYIRPSLVEYCKCIEPLYAKEKPKLMLEKFREMEDLLEEPAQQEPATKEKIREAIVFNLPLYTAPPQPKEPEQRSNEHLEPVAWMHPDGRLWTFGRGFDKSTFTIPLYTTPPQRTWVGLTEEEIEDCFHYVDEAGIGLFDFAEAIEAKLKEKNHERI